jgi:hypothetical protein
LRSLGNEQDLTRAVKVVQPAMKGQPFADVFLDSLNSEDSESETPSFIAPLPNAVPAEKHRGLVLQSKKKSLFPYALAGVIFVIFVGNVTHQLTKHFDETDRGTVVPRSPPFVSYVDPAIADPMFIFYRSVDVHPLQGDTADRRFAGTSPVFPRLKTYRWRRWLFREQVLIKKFAREHDALTRNRIELVDDGSWKTKTTAEQKEIADVWLSIHPQTKSDRPVSDANAVFWASRVHLLSDLEIAILREGDPEKTVHLDKLLYPDPTEYAVARVLRSQNWNEREPAKPAINPFRSKQRGTSR